MKDPNYCFWPSRSKWFDVGYDLLVLANDCLTDTPLGAPSEMFMDLEEPDFNCCDFVSVHMQVIRPIQIREGAFPEENFQPIHDCDGLYWVPRYEVTVGRNCRPLLDAGSTRPVPASAKEKTEYAQKVYYDAETLPCCINSKIAGGYELGGLTFSQQEIFPQQVYVETFGPCTRLRFRIMFDFDACCNPAENGYNDPDWAERRLSEGPLGPAPLQRLPSDCAMDSLKQDLVMDSLKQDTVNGS